MELLLSLLVTPAELIGRFGHVVTGANLSLLTVDVEDPVVFSSRWNTINRRDEFANAFVILCLDFGGCLQEFKRIFAVNALVADHLFL